MKKKYFLPIVLLFIGIVLLLIGAFIKVQGSDSGLLLWIGLLTEVTALITFLVKYFGSKD
jgi:hypothetical protein